MANSFNQYQIYIGTVIEKVSGALILDEFSQVFDTDSADVKVEEYSVTIRFIAGQPHNEFLEILSEFKQQLDLNFNERLFYKITVISL